MYNDDACPFAVRKFVIYDNLKIHIIVTGPEKTNHIYTFSISIKYFSHHESAMFDSSCWDMLVFLSTLEISSLAHTYKGVGEWEEEVSV